MKFDCLNCGKIQENLVHIVLEQTEITQINSEMQQVETWGTNESFVEFVEKLDDFVKMRKKKCQQES